MANRFDLLQYMSQRMDLLSKPKTPGPVLTISRQYGCSAQDLAQLLVQRIQQLHPNTPPWSWLNKEILDTVSQDMRLSPERVLEFFKGETADFVQQLFTDFGPERVVSDARLRSYLSTLITQLGNEGHKVIIGIGATAILQPHTRALHLRLIASQRWRLAYLSEHSHVSMHQLKNDVQQIDAHRDNLLTAFSGMQQHDELFDLKVNVARIDTEELVELLIRSMEMRGFF